MKKLLTIFILSVMFFGASAQSNKEDVDFLQSLLGKEKKTIVDAYMRLTPEKAPAFWTVYDQFETDRKSLGRDRIRLLDDYVNSLDNLTNDKAASLMKKAIGNEAAMTKLYRKYLPKFTKATSAIEAAKFMQLEFYIQSLIRTKLQEEVPLIDVVDGKIK